MKTLLNHRGSSLFTVLLLVAVTAPSLLAQSFTPEGPPRDQTGSPYRMMKLPNGLEVIVIENSTVPLVTVDIAVRNGAFTEPDEFAGLSHLYEHMFFKANKALPSQEQFMERVRELGIIFNGYTSDEVVNYFFTLPKKNLESGMKFMSDAIRTPLFKEEELVKEREVVIGEFDRNEAQPTFALRYAIDSALWMPYVSRKQPLGQRHVILTATVDKMQMIKDRFYIPNNSALIISGDVDADQVFKLAREYFSDWKRGEDPFPKYDPPAFPPLRPQLVMREAKIPYTLVRMHFFAPSINNGNNQDVYAAALVSTMLQQPTSKFYNNLADSGLVTGMFAGYDVAHNMGDFSFYLNTPPAKTRETIRVLKEQIQAMGRPGYFTREEIAVAKQIVADQKIFEQDNVFSFTIGTTARWWSMASLDDYLTFADNVKKLSDKQIMDFVNRYLVDKPFVLGIGAPQEAIDELNLTEEVLEWN